MFARVFFSLVLLSAVAAAGLGAYALRRRGVPGALPFALLMAGQFVWAGGYAGELLASSLEAKIFWDNLQFIGTDLVSGEVFLFGLTYTGRSVSLRRLGWLLVLPIANLLLVWTDPIHGLVRVQPHLVTNAAFPVLAYGYGLWMWLQVIYDYLLICLGLSVLAIHLKGQHWRYRSQGLAMILGLGAPLISVLLTVFGLVPLPQMHSLDISPIAFAIANPILAWGLFHGRLLDLVPIARTFLVEQMADGMLVVDARRRLIDCTPQARRLLGLADSIAVGQSLANTIPQLVPLLDQAPASPLVLLRGPEGWPAYNLEIQITRLETTVSGGYVWLLVLRDISARIQANELLHASEQRYRQLFDTMLNGFALHELICDSEGQPVNYRFLEVNAAFERITGLCATHVIGRTVLEVLPDIEPSWIASYGKVVQLGQPVSFEAYTRTLGQFYDVSAFCPQPGQFAVTIVDITARKRAEDLVRIRLRLSDLAQQQSLDDLIQAILDEAEAMTDSKIGFFHFVDADQENLMLQAWSTNTLQQICQARDQNQHYPLSKAGVWAECVYTRKPVIHNDYASLPHKKGLPEGHAPVVRELVVPVLRDDLVVAIIGMGNKPVAYTEDDVAAVRLLASTVMDLVERKQAEVERQRLEHAVQATQRLESLGVLAGGIAHDFNNILASVLGYADLAAAALPPTSEEYALVTQVIAGTKRAADLTAQILAYAGRGRFVVESVDLNALVRSNYAFIRASTLHQATIHYMLGDELPPITADATQIQQVLLNLVTNAAEAMGEAGGVIDLQTEQVHLSVSELAELLLGAGRPAGQYVCLRVTDCGCGMDAATCERVFEPFYTTKFTGRGLGLAVVHGIVRAHCGAIRVESTPGHGTTIRVFFPASDKPSSSSPEGPPSSPRRSEHGAILIVDDEAEVRQVIARLVRRLGYTAHQADDGPTALAKLHEGIPQLYAVLLDLTMPQMPGEAVARAIRATYPALPIILMSGYSTHELAQRGADLDIQGILQKPFTLDVLQHTLGGFEAPIR